ncbi:alpha/beta fold hydrolase [Alteromonas sediminis]|uniref:Alpha/beta fold hydrolase n=1 Tax=Alteromonas sediminis TaxID=2259342 RepID=A0A3N5YDA7_9ALTE|nr:alpha/beta fold hydrolase [Alteromonas sediminis]RPJ67505.1 alpha/beta fold hydrolase [Alteromonas sediminis]
MLNFDKFTASKKNAPKVVLIHGLFGDKDNLSALRKSLQDEYHVLAIDLPNHGASEHIDKWSFKQVAALLKKTFDAIDFKPDALVGHSLGGKVAMAYALEYPNDLACAVIADIAPASYPARHDNVFNALNAVAAKSINQRAEASDILSATLKEKATQQFLLKSFKKSQTGWHWQFNLKGLESDYQALSGWPYDTQSTQTNMLFVKGQESDYLTTCHTDSVNRHFPNAKVKVIAGTGHWLHAEKPVVFNRIVTQFLQQTIV